MKIISLFSGAGGLDLGFKNAGFNIVWANEFDKDIWETYSKNHKKTILDDRSIRNIPSSMIPDCDGIIGGPPCQSWSESGARRGIDDARGQLFFEYIRILKDKKPAFFLAENVSGMLAKRHSDAFRFILKRFSDTGYNVECKLLNVRDYNVSQDRKRVIFIGYRKNLNKRFIFPEKSKKSYDLRDAIWDLRNSAIPAKNRCYTQGNRCKVPNHEYLVMGFSPIYMSRNRVRAWDEPSFTIQAGGRHAPMHPKANKMVKKGPDEFQFDKKSRGEYRRLTVRECARIQTFPDDFIFYYDRLYAGYKMVGNAVPVNLAFVLAKSIKVDLMSKGISKYGAKKQAI